MGKLTYNHPVYRYLSSTFSEAEWFILGILGINVTARCLL